jgi:superfamily II DNA helicase RecQ
LMALHFFNIPAMHPEQAQEALNAFIAGANVVTVQKELVACGAHSFWTVAVEVAQTTEALPGVLKGEARQRIDYKEVLNERDFFVFDALRTARGGWARSEGVPFYHVATNAQLAHMAQQRCQTSVSLEQVPLFGAARLQKYGPRFLQVLGQFVGEASGEA